MKFGSLCALGGFTPYPVMSAITHFPEDFAPPEAGGAGRPRRKSKAPPRTRSGQPIAHWKTLIDAGMTHMQLVNWLKETDNALVADTLAQRLSLIPASPIFSWEMGLIHEIDYGTPASKSEKRSR
jgi:hypothetical protein